MLSDAIHDNLPALKNACEHYTNDPTWQNMYPADGPHSVVVRACLHMLEGVRRELDTPSYFGLGNRYTIERWARKMTELNQDETNGGSSINAQVLGGE